MYAGFGILPDNTTIAANKPYVFIFKLSFFSKNTAGLEEQLSSYASNISISKDGSDITISLTPLYSMPLSGWRSAFNSAWSAIGSSATLKNFYAGAAPKGQLPDPTWDQNVANYWSPKLKTLGVPDAFSWVKTVTIAGAVIAGSMALMHISSFLPKSKK